MLYTRQGIGIPPRTSMLMLSVLFLFYGVPVTAQQPGHIPARSHSVQAEFYRPQVFTGDTLTIVAVMVEFQPDDNRFTSGTGTFGPGSLPYLEQNDITIDPLPHDSSYFASHLLFAKNYFETVSGNALTLEYRVLPQIYRLPQKMEAYSPTGESFTLEKLALLVRDTWQAVDDSGGFDDTGLDPGTTAFAIFHAGVGRDIELTGTSLDKTPQDIPSLFLDRGSLGSLLEIPSFQGFPVNNGAFRVTNSMILPRTLSRRGEDITGEEFVFQLSINGLLAASVGSYLGLPDLFNTQTGSSGIGRFGLMDGESFFSYRGLFPPEPSAWEKNLMGWQNPFPISTADAAPVTLPAAALRQPGSIGKYALSPYEYFLVENRHRDPQDNGVTLTIRKNDGSQVQQHFDNTDEAFVSQGESFPGLLEAGVLTGVSTFDWSLPGGMAGDRELNGGILIWHIDEGVIESGFDAGTVNTDPGRRGVDLEEADGAQDIGSDVSARAGIPPGGTPFDFWWEGNNASVITVRGDTVSFYENRFGMDTRPSNESNSGAPSFFEFYAFSPVRPVAEFRARRAAAAGIEPVSLPLDTLPEQNTFIAPGEPYLSDYPLSLQVYTAQDDTFLIIPSGSRSYALQLDGAGGSPLFDFGQAGIQQPYLGQYVILGDKPGSASAIALNAWDWTGAAWQNAWNAAGTPNEGFISSLDDNVLLLDQTVDRFRVQDGELLSESAEPEVRSVTLGNRYISLADNRLRVAGTGFNTGVAPAERQYAGAVQLTSGENAFYYLDDDRLLLVEPGKESPVTPLVDNTDFGWPAMADLDGDRRNDFIYVNYDRNRLEAVNRNGAMLDFFPVHPPQGSRFTGTPLVADLQGDGLADLIIGVRDSLSYTIHSFNHEGKPNPGFPLLAGSSGPPGAKAIHPVIEAQRLYTLDYKGHLNAWKFPGMTDVQWTSKYGNEPYNKVTGRFLGAGGPTAGNALLDPGETYNWPNPADSFTHIRYKTGGPGEVEIKIINLSGRVLYHQTFSTGGGTPAEQRVDTSHWGSGIYLAQVTATVNGQNSSKLLKIAIIH